MSVRDEAGPSEARIAVHWREEEYYQPPPAFVEQANASDPAILDGFSEEHANCADLLEFGRSAGLLRDRSLT